MSRNAAIFTEAQVTRALKGARKAGYSVNKAVINRAGDIVLTFGPPEHESDDKNPWDEVLINASHEKRSS